MEEELRVQSVPYTVAACRVDCIMRGRCGVVWGGGIAKPSQHTHTNTHTNTVATVAATENKLGPTGLTRHTTRGS